MAEEIATGWWLTCGGQVMWLNVWKLCKRTAGRLFRGYLILVDNGDFEDWGLQGSSITCWMPLMFDKSSFMISAWWLRKGAADWFIMFSFNVILSSLFLLCLILHFMCFCYGMCTICLTCITFNSRKLDFIISKINRDLGFMTRMSNGEWLLIHPSYNDEFHCFTDWMLVDVDLN